MRRKPDPMLETLPAGVNWEPSPIFDFSRSPRLWGLPDTLRHIIVAHLVSSYGGLQEEGRTVSMLDAACGFAEQYHLLKTNRMGAGTRLHYTGIDVDPRKRLRALSYYPDLDYRLGDLTTEFLTLAGPAARYDIIVSTETLEHFKQEDGIQFLENCMSLLAPGGSFILTVPNPNLHRDNKWHLYEWPRAELAQFVAGHEDWVVRDKFDLKIDTRTIKAALGLPPETGRRIPNELLRGAMAGVGEGTVMVYVLGRGGERA